MKKICFLIFICAFAFWLAGCRPAPIYCEDVCNFSYEEELALYQEETSRVKHTEFINTSELSNTIKWDNEAIEQAAKECPIEWHNTTTYYDLTSKIWKIEFWDTRDTEGYPSYIYQTVYMNDKGVTLLVIYGE